jgi:hypothetical protein
LLLIERIEREALSHKVQSRWSGNLSKPHLKTTRQSWFALMVVSLSLPL